MLYLICELTRQRLPTPDIRARVQLLFADIPWNERRFYNRLSEERQKQRVRDAEARVQQLHGLWSNVVAAAAGSQELTEIAQADIHRMVDKLCSMAQTDASTLPVPLVHQPSDHDLEDPYDTGGQASSQDAMDTTGDSSSQDEVSPSQSRLYIFSHSNHVFFFSSLSANQQHLLHGNMATRQQMQIHQKDSQQLQFLSKFSMSNFMLIESSKTSNNFTVDDQGLWHSQTTLPTLAMTLPYPPLVNKRNKRHPC
jgi:hypothetical protein